MNDILISLPKPPPIEVEHAVLASMMTTPATVDPCAEILKPADFAHIECGVLFSVIVARHQASLPVDPVSITAHCFQAGTMDSIGGAATIAQICGASPDPAAAKSYAKEIQQASKRRQMARIGAELARAASEDGEEYEDSAKRAIREIDGVLLNSCQSEIIHIRDVALAYTEAYEAGLENNIDPPVSTGIKAMDEIMEGGIRREYIIIGGKQGSGKTVLAMQFAGALASDGRRGLIVGYEMSARQMLMRDLARETGIPLNEVMGRRALQSDYNMKKLTNGVTKIAMNWDVSFTESPFISLESVAAHARALHRVKPLDFLVIDYLQLVPMKRNGKERTDEMLKSISDYCERLRKDLNCTLVAPVQLNDGGEIRDSRSILDSPQVFLKIQMEDKEGEDGEMESGDLGTIKFVKNRFGANNRSVYVFRNGPLQRFEDTEERPAKKEEKKTYRPRF